MPPYALRLTESLFIGAMAVCRCRKTEWVRVPSLLLSRKSKWVSVPRMGVPGARAHKTHGGRLSQDDRIGIQSCLGHSVGDSPVTDTGI